MTGDHQSCIALITVSTHAEAPFYFFHPPHTSDEDESKPLLSASAAHTTQQKPMRTPTDEFNFTTGQIGFCGVQEAADGAASRAEYLGQGDFWGEQNVLCSVGPTLLLCSAVLTLLYKYETSAASK